MHRAFIYKYTSNEKVFKKNRVIRIATKRTERTNLQRNALTSLIHFVQLYSKVDRDVSALRWRSYTCFCPFCGSPNCPVFLKNFFITCKYVL